MGSRAYSLTVAAVAAHSLLLGGALLIAPLPLVRWVGWSFDGSGFFPAQSGLFLVILGMVYTRAVAQPSLAWIVVLSKAMAVLFLVTETLAGNAPKVILPIAAADGCMGLAVWLLRPRARA